MNSVRLATGLVSIGLLAGIGLAGAAAAPADGAIRARSYQDCTALHKVYPHGVGLRGAKDRTRGSSKPVTTFTRSATLYHLNDGRADGKVSRGEHDLDRDNDGIACEKR